LESQCSSVLISKTKLLYNCNPTVKQGGVSVLTWGCMSTKGVEMTFINGTMNASLFTQIQDEKMTPRLQQLGRRGIFQT
uniref:Uncharacterized protein n=1 Tax=Seriola lalandi dorsalis TaxID=1841481 RepID=A0A3B4WF74_SERLL